MEFNQGDIVTGHGIMAGKYLGLETIEVGDLKTDYHKIYDKVKSMVHYLPDSNSDTLRKLPSKATFNKYLKMMSNEEMIDLGEIEGSRYKYLKNKLESGNLKPLFEVFHDLYYLKHQQKLSVSERKLYNNVTDKLASEVKFVFNISEEEALNKIQQIH